MKLNQNFFWDKFLLIWGIIGMLFPVVVVMRFEVKGLFELLLLGGMSVSCALLTATIGWKCCSKLHWIPLSISMAVAFCSVVVIMTLIVTAGDYYGTIMLLACLFPILLLPCILLILVVNYLMLRKQHSSWNHNCIIKILVVFLQTEGVVWQVNQYMFLYKKIPAIGSLSSYSRDFSIGNHQEWRNRDFHYAAFPYS